MPSRNEVDLGSDESTGGPKVDKSVPSEESEARTGDWSSNEPGTIDDDDAGTDMPWPRE